MRNILLGLMLSAFLTSVAFADLPERYKNKGEIVAAIMPNYPPMDFKDPDSNEITGVDYDMGTEIARRLGVKIIWREIAYEQMVSALVTRRADIILSGMSDTVERQQVVTFVDYFTNGAQLYTLLTRDDINDVLDFCGKRVGTSRRTTFPAELRQWSIENCEANGRPAINVVGAEGTADARVQLRQGRLDGALQGNETLAYTMSIDSGVYKLLGEPINRKLTGLGVSKANEDLAEAIKEVLQSMIDDGTYMKILKKWGVEAGALDKITINAETERIEN